MPDATTQLDSHCGGKLNCPHIRIRTSEVLEGCVCIEEGMVSLGILHHEGVVERLLFSWQDAILVGTWMAKHGIRIREQLNFPGSVDVPPAATGVSRAERPAGSGATFPQQGTERHHNETAPGPKEAGGLAHAYGWGRDYNPYPEGTAAHKEWDDSWQEAEALLDS